MTTPRTLIALSLALIAPLAAQADELFYSHGQGPQFDTSVSTLTRAEVIAELVRHDPNAVGPDGWRNIAGYSVFVGTPGAGKSRAEVQRELAEFKRNPVGADGWLTEQGFSTYVGHGRSSDARLAGGDAAAAAIR